MNIDRIQMTIREYLETVLYHPQYGYYSQDGNFGPGVDYVTAPLMSQVFGEMAGLWLTDAMLRRQNIGSATADLTSPPFSRLHYIELGPGTGVLAQDILRVARRLTTRRLTTRRLSPQDLATLPVTVSLVETSPYLTGLQNEALAAMDNVSWYPRFEDVPVLPDAMVWLVANEFFDALPVEQYIRGQPLTVTQEPSDTRHRGGVIPYTFRRNALPFAYKDSDIEEVCPLMNTIASKIKEHLLQAPACAGLIIDYGDDTPAPLRRGDTLQALYRNRPCAVFDHPGKADISHQTDFNRLLGLLAAPEFSLALHPQSEFLESCGFSMRTRQLCAMLPPDEANALLQAGARLIRGAEMGRLFHVLTIEDTRGSIA